MATWTLFGSRTQIITGSPDMVILFLWASLAHYEKPRDSDPFEPCQKDERFTDAMQPPPWERDGMHFSQLCMWQCGDGLGPTKPCPIDKPSGVRAGPPECVLADIVGRKYCALTCECEYDPVTRHTDCLEPSTGCDTSSGGCASVPPPPPARPAPLAQMSEASVRPLRYCDILLTKPGTHKAKGICAWPAQQHRDAAVYNARRRNWGERVVAIPANQTDGTSALWEVLQVVPPANGRSEAVES